MNVTTAVLLFAFLVALCGFARQARSPIGVEPAAVVSLAPKAPELLLCRECRR